MNDPSRLHGNFPVAFTAVVSSAPIPHTSQSCFISRANPHHQKPAVSRKRQRSSRIVCLESKRHDSPKSTETLSASAKFLDTLLSGFQPSPELAAILSVYFVQGALGISRLAISFFLKDDLHLSPAQCAALTGAAMFPWLIKPVYGFLSDSLPLFGYRRRSYLIGAGALGVAAWTSLATFVNSAPLALVATIASSMSVAISDVVADSIVVERVRELPAERSGALQSLCWGTSAVGGLLSAYFSGSLIETLGVREVFALTAILPITTTLFAGLISEERVSPESVGGFLPTAKQRSLALWDALRNPSVYLPVAFIFAWQATPSPESALFFFSTNVLGFGPEFLGRVRLASSGAALFGLWLYRSYLSKLDVKTQLFWSTIASVPLSLTQVILVTRANIPLGISDQFFALTDSAVLTALGQVAFMPTLVLAARMCPPGVEGTLFAALMSVYNASGAVSSELGALLTTALGVNESNFDNLWILITICSFSGLLALPLLRLIDEAPPEQDEEPFIRAEDNTAGDIEKAVSLSSSAQQVDISKID